MSKKKKKHRAFRRFFWMQFMLLLVLCAGLFFYMFGAYGKEVRKLKRDADMLAAQSNKDTFQQSQTSIIYDAEGNILSKLKGERDTYYLSADQIPVNVQQAIVTIEDKKFYEHSGVDYRAIVRAAWAMLRNGKVTQGASTITQQLARNVFLSQERIWQRKVEEIFLARDLEKKYTKNQILEFYINNIYFGNGYYGIQAAAKGYFNTDIENLDISQVAYLCAIPNNPSLYDPVNHSENTLKRRNRILRQMNEDGKLSDGAMNLALAEEITLNRPKKVEKNDYAETFAKYCAIRALMTMQGFSFQEYFDTAQEKSEYETLYDETYNQCQQQLYTKGYRIYTSLNIQVQEQLQQSIDNNLAAYTSTNEQGVLELQSAGVCVDNKTGMVCAVVGGRKQEFTGYTLNRAYQSFRQPGSSIKPLVVYTPSLEKGYTPDSVVDDTPVEDGPSNAGGVYGGSISLRYAVEHSRNVVAWRLMKELTPEEGLRYLKEMHFSKLDAEDYRLTAALGGLTNGVSPLEMAAGYATLENDGAYRDPTCILRVMDSNGTELYRCEQEESHIYTETAARMMTDILTGVLTQGTAAGMGLENMPAAGKTGTTNDNKDGWFVGFTRYYTTSIWVGYDMPREVPGLSGSSYPAQIWHDFMSAIHEGLDPLEFLPYADPGMPKESGSQPDEEVSDPEISEEASQGDLQEPSQEPIVQPASQEEPLAPQTEEPTQAASEEPTQEASQPQPEPTQPQPENPQEPEPEPTTPQEPETPTQEASQPPEADVQIE